MGRVYRSYTDKERANCVATLIGLGYPDVRGSLLMTSELTGVASSTLQGWFHEQHNPPPPDLLEESKLELKQLVENELRQNFHVMRDKRAEASYRDLAWANAVFIDKLQLLNGQPTGNVKNVISFERTGITSLPEHLAPLTIEGTVGEETV